jgi:perosamine synthetase
MTNLQAALGLAQLERMDQIVAKKRWIGQSYTKRLQDISTLQLPVEQPFAKSVYWMYGMILTPEAHMTAADLAKRLDDFGIQTRPFFLGMHEQPVFHRRGLFAGESYPVAERIAERGLYLPSGLAITERQLRTVCDAVHEVLA